MAKTRDELRDAVTEETGVAGSSYNTKINRHLTQAEGVIYTVRWRWRYGTSSFTTSFDQTKYALSSEVQSVDPDSFYIGNDKLVAGSLKDIALTGAEHGQPLRFNISGMSGNSRQIYIGAPTTRSGQAYTVKYGYWAKAQGFDSGTAISPISYAYSDQPIIDYACYLLYMSQEQNQKAGQCLQKFLIHMKVMESNLVYDGPSYTDLLQGIREMAERNEKN